MDRRTFLRNSAILAAGVVAVDQLELLERLAPRRLYWPGASFATPMRHTVRTGLPSVVWRKLNEGVPASKGLYRVASL